MTKSRQVVQLSKYWQLTIILKSCKGLRIKYSLFGLLYTGHLRYFNMIAILNCLISLLQKMCRKTHLNSFCFTGCGCRRRRAQLTQEGQTSLAPPLLSATLEEEFESLLNSRLSTKCLNFLGNKNNFSIFLELSINVFGYISNPINLSAKGTTDLRFSLKIMSSRVFSRILKDLPLKVQTNQPCPYYVNRIVCDCRHTPLCIVYSEEEFLENVSFWC